MLFSVLSSHGLRVFLPKMISLPLFTLVLFLFSKDWNVSVNDGPRLSFHSVYKIAVGGLHLIWSLVTVREWVWKGPREAMCAWKIQNYYCSCFKMCLCKNIWHMLNTNEMWLSVLHGLLYGVNGFEKRLILYRGSCMYFLKYFLSLCWI